MVNQEANCSSLSFTTSCEPASLSCYLLSALAVSPSVRLVTFQEEQQMQEAFSRAELRASLLIRANFSRSLMKRLLRPELFTKFSWWYGVGEVGPGEKVVLSLDTSEPLISGQLKQTVATSLLEFSRWPGGHLSPLVGGSGRCAKPTWTARVWTWRW